MMPVRENSEVVVIYPDFIMALVEILMDRTLSKGKTSGVSTENMDLLATKKHAHIHIDTHTYEEC